MQLPTIKSAVVEDFSSVWSDLLVNSVKIDDDVDVTDFENENENLRNFIFTLSHVFRAFGCKPSSVN